MSGGVGKVDRESNAYLLGSHDHILAINGLAEGEVARSYVLRVIVVYRGRADVLIQCAFDVPVAAVVFGVLRSQVDVCELEDDLKPRLLVIRPQVDSLLL